MNETKDKLRGFLSNSLGLDLKDVGDEDELFSSGLVDSFSLIEILSFLEGEFDTKIDIAELGIDELDTINALSLLASNQQD